MRISNLEYVSNEELYKGEGAKPILVQDSIIIQTGEYYGRGKKFYTFKSRNRNVEYAVFTIGTQICLSNNEQHVLEFERIWSADFRKGSQLIKTLDKLGAVSNGKVHPDMLENLPVKFTLKANTNSTDEKTFKEYISDIEVVEELPEQFDFHYLKVKNPIGYELVPTNESIQSIGKESSASLTELFASINDESDDDYLEGI